jgi:heme/copper-type cytochrome/quinol oxidase subunit 3
MNLINNKKDLFSIFFTIFLAILFLLIQLEEYFNIFFSFRERNFRRIFFFSTGFHGLHVFLGLIFIIINFFRLLKIDFFIENILSLEFSIIY